jgi:predicted TIM-barrel fold metal-dependent hydrolase
LHRRAARIAAFFGPRCVWGSDWPHTGQAQLPTYAQTWAPVPASLGADAADAVRRQQPLALYR